MWIAGNCGQFLKRWNTRTPYLPAEKCLCRSRSNRPRHGTKDWFQTGKRVCQGYILSPWLFDLYAEYIMRNAGLNEAQVGIKIAGRNINNHRYAPPQGGWHHPYGRKWRTKEPLDESERGKWKAGLKLSIQKTKIMTSGPIISWQIDGETMETATDFIFLGSKITADGDCSHEIKRCLLFGRIAMTNIDSILRSRDITLLTKVHYLSSNPETETIYLARTFLILFYGCNNLV